MADDVVKELFDKWKIVTELQIRRLEWGFTRPDMADSIASFCDEGTGVNGDCLTDCERRRRNPTGRLAIALCKRFGVSSVVLLGLGRAKETARWWTWMTLDEKDFLVNRRTLLKGAATAGLLVPVPELVYYAQIIGRRKGHIIGEGDVASAQATATDLAIAYAADPASDTVRAARSHALTLLDLLKPSNATIKELTTRRRLQSVTSDACALAGYADMNAGRLDDADRWFRCALHLAREAEDRRLEALALASSAWVLLHQPQTDRAAVVAALEAAAGFHPVLRPAGRAYVFGSLAARRAALGDDLGSGRFLHEAQSAAALIPHDGSGWGWLSTHGELYGWDGSVRPQSYMGSRLLGLGRPAEALGLYGTALDGTTRPVRRAFLHRLIMEACVGVGDLDQACASAVTALDEGQRHGVGVIVGEVRKARAAFPKSWLPQGLVVDLDERLRLAA